MGKSKSLVEEFKGITGVDISADEELVGKLKLRKFPLTKFTITYLDKIPNIKPIKRDVILHYFKLTKKQVSLYEIAEKYRYGVEVLRQFKKSLKTNPYVNFLFIEKLIPFINPKSSLFIDKLSPFVLVGDALAAKVGKEENISVSKEFLAFLMYQVNKDNFYLLFEDDTPRTKKESLKYKVYYVNKKFKANYLVNKKKIDRKKLYVIVSKIIELYSGKARMEDIEINLNKVAKETLNNDYLQLLKVILKEGYGLEVNGNKVLFKRNAILLAHEYVEKILRKEGKMMHLDDIMKRFKTDYPEVHFEESSIRVNVCNHDKLFFTIGRASTYGLKEWTKTDKTIRGGTIRDIAEEYLNRFQKPVHINEIFKFVSKFRETSKKSVLNNLMMMHQKDIFTFYWGGYVGLKSKKYKETPARQIGLKD